MSELKAYILCQFAEKSSIYTSWMDECPLPCVVVKDYVPDWPVPDDAGIIITHMHYRWEEYQLLRSIYEKSKIPVLVLADGILEYRNTWEHPELAEGSIFQPLVGHKLACIGRGQARVVESWGNAGKCEIVGQPRFDDVRSCGFKPVNGSGPFRLLIATANTPAFNDEQRATVVDSLTHIKSRLEQNSKVGGRPTTAIWRLTDGLEDEIGVPVDGDPNDRPSIGDMIEEVDAVITTPSTLYLQSVLKKRPTAILDFHNSPAYVSAAWTINAPKHFNWILGELASPPPAKIAYQEFVLHDQLECATPAKPRLLNLISKMVAAGVAARTAKMPIELPARIINENEQAFARIDPDFDLTKLYPDNEHFKNPDIARLQIELTQAVKRLEQYPEELLEKNRFLASTISLLHRSRLAGADMYVRMQDMQNRMQQLLDRIENFHERIERHQVNNQRLRERLLKYEPDNEDLKSAGSAKGETED